MKMVMEADEHLGKTDLSDMIAEAELADKHKKMLDVFLADVTWSFKNKLLNLYINR
ncbi:DNA relaxase NicK [Bacillus safensis]|nr:DNA relaxase NicK [Bacillus safensis]